jgi:hypothetical protein
MLRAYAARVWDYQFGKLLDDLLFGFRKKHVFVATCFCQQFKIHVERASGLTAHAIVHALNASASAQSCAYVVEQNVLEILQRRLTDRHKRAHVHQQRTCALSERTAARIPSPSKQNTCLLSIACAMPSAIDDAWPIEPTVRKSRQTPSCCRWRIS